ncbi:Autophagy-related protein [Quillaja saponaria]|uniref:Autophagy-related protein n=1 Tax=Quillaja saponaria TaxID=32244 RepID=A0AAD7PJ09_QUISA|nr:Autophagy-related protein [Quillaja saponaria]
MGEMQTGAAVEKLFSLWKDEYRRFSGLKMSSTSLRQISFSRSSSRSYHDHYDDPDFTCPFDVDDDDMADPSSRAESLDQGHRCEPLEHGRLFPIKKSQDASVGTLVRMLKKAPPLCQDFSGSVDLSQGSRAETLSNNIREAKKIPGALTPVSAMSSGLVMRKKTTTDALEELQGYREMKNFLLMRGSNSHI